MIKHVKASSAYVWGIAFVLCVFVSGSFGLEPPMQRSKSDTVKIMEIEGSSFTVNERKFTIDANTDIRDRFNRKIKLHLMWAPCKADVEYVVSKGMEYRCLKIKVKEELDKELVNTEVSDQLPQ